METMEIRRWKSEYLTDLREYHPLQAKKTGRYVAEGDVVIVMDEGKLPRGRWRLGHVMKLIEGADKVMRGATVDVIGSGKRRIQMNRPVQKLIPLEVNLLVQSNSDKNELRPLRNLPRRAAAIDADWRRQVLDQLDLSKGRVCWIHYPLWILTKDLIISLTFELMVLLC